MSRSDSPDIDPPLPVHSDRTPRSGGVPRRAADVRSRVVTRFRYLSFLTDYGLEDGFVAACHGVSARIAPHADIIDVTHLIPPGDVRRGAAVLAQTVPYLPPAVHVAVVDPGVGTARRGVAVAAGDFGVHRAGQRPAVLGGDRGGRRRARVQPDQRQAVAQPGDADLSRPGHLHAGWPRIWRRTRNSLQPERRSTSADLGPCCQPRNGWCATATAEGEVLTVDRFGNVQLTITGADAAEIGVKPGGTVLVHCGFHQLTLPYREMFGAVATGDLVAYTDSAGLVSICG